jgi:hypothetical protein
MKMMGRGGNENEEVGEKEDETTRRGRGRGGSDDARRRGKGEKARRGERERKGEAWDVVYVRFVRFVFGGSMDEWEGVCVWHTRHTHVRRPWPLLQY